MKLANVYSGTGITNCREERGRERRKRVAREITHLDKDNVLLAEMGTNQRERERDKERAQSCPEQVKYTLGKSHAPDLITIVTSQQLQGH